MVSESIEIRKEVKARGEICLVSDCLRSSVSQNALLQPECELDVHSVCEPAKQGKKVTCMQLQEREKRARTSPQVHSESLLSMQVMQMHLILCSSGRRFLDPTSHTLFPE